MPCTSWFHDKSDLQLYEMLPFLDAMADADSVLPLISQARAANRWTFFGAPLTAPIEIPHEARAEHFAQLAAPGSPRVDDNAAELIQVSVGS